MDLSRVSLYVQPPPTRSTHPPGFGQHGRSPPCRAAGSDFCLAYADTFFSSAATAADDFMRSMQTPQMQNVGQSTIPTIASHMPM